MCHPLRMAVYLPHFHFRTSQRLPSFNALLLGSLSGRSASVIPLIRRAVVQRNNVPTCGSKLCLSNVVRPVCATVPACACTLPTGFFCCSLPSKWLPSNGHSRVESMFPGSRCDDMAIWCIRRRCDYYLAVICVICTCIVYSTCRK